MAKKESIREKVSAKLCKLSDINISEPERKPPNISNIVIKRFKKIEKMNLKFKLP